jgi:hypothetical protein
MEQVSKVEPGSEKRDGGMSRNKGGEEGMGGEDGELEALGEWAWVGAGGPG